MNSKRGRNAAVLAEARKLVEGVNPKFTKRDLADKIGVGETTLGLMLRPGYTNKSLDAVDRLAAIVKAYLINS